MVTMKDIAAKCGVSVSTVSKALNDQNDIGIETKNYIREQALSMGYHPHFAARALKTHRSYDIGVLFVDEDNSGLTHDYFSHLLNSFKSAAEEKGYDLTFITNSRKGVGTMSYLEHCENRGFDGALIACVNFHDPQVVELIQSKIPVVTIDHIFNECTSILSDNAKGMSDLLHFIYDQGHRKVAYLYGNDTSVTKVRLSSFYKTAEELGLEVPAEYIRASAYRNMKGAAAITDELLSLKNPPTCIVYPDDFSAFGGINAIRQRGLRIPEDVSVAGYDGVRLGKYLEPPLTTVKQDTDRIGTIAAERLIAMIENPKTAMADQVIVAGELMPGGSVGKLNVMK